ncbi:hypothetical protein [Synechococcus sp. CBW1004]|uniref:hypothetical protein n=1 Tax=Synechococcus sp. CBW1004 TaxID=1353136 RepID=UPI0018CE8E9E|nr:hypothetical protein [Synechococcus sp. CBW1004]QPN63439.1 hypothetical protein H8F25_00575 [Synechococcus sp. CBW1004]
MPDPSSSPLHDNATEPDNPDRPKAPPKAGGWPLWLRILLAALLLSFVWSPFLAMLMRLSRVNPGLQPTGGSSNFTPPAQPAPSGGPAASPPAPAPSP